MKKSLIIVYSYHHHNTEKVANAMAKILDCEIEGYVFILLIFTALVVF